jgi:hypothetical protein
MRVDTPEVAALVVMVFYGGLHATTRASALFASAMRIMERLPSLRG